MKSLNFVLKTFFKKNNRNIHIPNIYIRKKIYKKNTFFEFSHKIVSINKIYRFDYIQYRIDIFYKKKIKK